MRSTAATFVLPNQCEYWSLLKKNAVSNLFFDIISYFFDKFKNIAHSLEPGETSSFTRLQNFAVRLRIFFQFTRLQNFAVRLRLFFQFT